MKKVVEYIKGKRGIPYILIIIILLMIIAFLGYQNYLAPKKDVDPVREWQRKRTVNKDSFVVKKLYNYVQRQNSITYTYNDKLYDVTKVLNELIQYYDKQGLKHDYDDILEFVYIRYMYATFIKRLAKSKDKRRFRDGVNFAIKHVNEMYPKYKKNKFLSNKSIKNFYLKNFNRFFANIIYGIEKNRMN